MDVLKLLQILDKPVKDMLEIYTGSIPVPTQIPVSFVPTMKPILLLDRPVEVALLDKESSITRCTFDDLSPDATAKLTLYLINPNIFELPYQLETGNEVS